MPHWEVTAFLNAYYRNQAREHLELMSVMGAAFNGGKGAEQVAKALQQRANPPKPKQVSEGAWTLGLAQGL